MDIFFRFRFISGILLPKVKTTFGNRMLFKLFNLKVKLQTEYFQESDETKILTVESSCDWFEDTPLFEFWIIGSLYIVVGISKTIVSGEIIGDNRYIDVIFELWISNKKVKNVQKLADIHVVCSLFSNDLFKLFP